MFSNGVLLGLPISELAFGAQSLFINYTIIIGHAPFCYLVGITLIEVGKIADMVLIDSNPLENLKVLYGTGAIKLNENNEVVRVGGVKYTISNGVIYDAKGLLNEVKMMVDRAKKEEGFEIKQPGVN